MVNTSRIILLATIAAVLKLYTGRRGAVVPRKRLKWQLYRERLLREGQFKRYYRMSAASFDTLLTLVSPLLARDNAQSIRRSGTKPITPTNMLQMAISWLAGGSYHSIRALAGVSRTAFYSILVEVMNALCTVKELRIVATVGSLSATREAAN